MNATEINEVTGFANGDKFTSENEVRDYFTTRNIDFMFGECRVEQSELDEMAEFVITNRLHFDEHIINGLERLKSLLPNGSTVYGVIIKHTETTRTIRFMCVVEGQMLSVKPSTTTNQKCFGIIKCISDHVAKVTNHKLTNDGNVILRYGADGCDVVSILSIILYGTHAALRYEEV